MNLTRSSLERPAVVAAIVAIVSLFGVLAWRAMPIQLLPDLARPIITVSNTWPQAAPADLEATIIEPQEAVLRLVSGVREVTSTINQGVGSVTLEFDIGADMDRALINTIAALNQAPPRPLDAREPVVTSGGVGVGQIVSTVLIRPLPDNPDKDLHAPHYQAAITDRVHPRLIRIPGVAAVQLNSQRRREVQIEFDPYRAAALGIPVTALTSAVSAAVNTSGGFADVGRKRYTVRLTGQQSIEGLGQLIVAWNDGRPVRLHEVADVSLTLSETYGVGYRNGFPTYYIVLQRANGANSVAIIDALNEALDELNAPTGALGSLGLVADLSFDASVYVRRALKLLQGSLVVGVLLALAVLWFFMRDRRAMLTIAVVIPVSLLGALMVIHAFGLSLNVISLAGLAFAVGLVLDAAIIVQENILRYRQRGDAVDAAVAKGADQVQGALFAATTTTIAVFVPILFLTGIEGQLFRDLAVTLSAAVVASMLAALSVVPVLNRRWLASGQDTDPHAQLWRTLAARVTASTDRPAWCWAWIFAAAVLPFGLALALKPSTDFLPSARADAVTVFFNLPSGPSQRALEEEFSAEVIARLKPHMDHERAPYIRGYNLQMNGILNILFLYPERADETDAWVSLLSGPMLQDIPDLTPFTVRASLLGLGLDTGRSISMDFRGPDVAGLMSTASVAANIIRDRIPGAVVQPVPALSLSEPQLEVVPHGHRLVEAGLDPLELSRAVRAMTGGLFVSEYFDGNDRYNVVLRTRRWSDPAALAAMPVWTPLAGPQPIDALADIRRGVGATRLQRVNGQRTVSLLVAPPDTMTVEDALEILRSDVEPRLADSLPAGSSVGYRGSADQLEAALTDMLRNFALAILVLAIVIAAIFNSVRDALLVVFVMPLALSGGLLALKLLNLITYQSLDMLTMIGFIVLLGLVVNNAILLVAETRFGQRAGMALRDAVEAAVRVRARPVYMSTLTSVFGMLPLMLVPGTGSDIYRGLATVIVGGMLFSAAFTLVLMPAMMRVSETWRFRPLHIMIAVFASCLVAGPIQAAPAAAVMVQEVVRRSIAPTVAVTATVHSRDEVQVTAGIDGRLAFVSEPGTQVPRGEPLARIDTSALELRRTELAAQAERATAVLRFLDSQLVRQRDLAESRVLSESDLEQTISQRDMAASDLRIAEVRMLQITEDIARATATVGFDAVVTERLHRGGEDVSRGTVIARVIDIEALEVRASAPLRFNHRVAVGDRIRVRGNGWDGAAVVRSVIPVTDARRQAFELRADLSLDGHRGTIGELVSVELPLLEPAGMVAVPQDALILRQEGTFVYRVSPSGTAERVPVTIGASKDGYVLVDAPLVEGDRVVIRGGEVLAPGQRIRVL